MGPGTFVCIGLAVTTCRVHGIVVNTDAERTNLQTKTDTGILHVRAHVEDLPVHGYYVMSGR